MDRPFDVVNHFDIYCVDRDFGPFFVKFCTYFPYNAKLCLNGHEYAKQQLANKGIGFKALDTRSGAADLRPPRHGADAGQVSHAGDGVAPSLHVDYKNTRITQYHKEGRALRTETTINNTHGLVRLHTPIRSL